MSRSLDLGCLSALDGGWGGQAYFNSRKQTIKSKISLEADSQLVGRTSNWSRVLIFSSQSEAEQQRSGPTGADETEEILLVQIKKHILGLNTILCRSRQLDMDFFSPNGSVFPRSLPVLFV